MKGKKSETMRTKIPNWVKNIEVKSIKEKSLISNLMAHNSKEITNAALLVDKSANINPMAQILRFFADETYKELNERKDLFTDDFIKYCSLAIEKGIVEITPNNRLKWNRKNVALSYFLHRIFGEGVQWKEWEYIFDMQYLKQSLYNHNEGGKKPKWKIEIDSLFD